MSRRLNKDREEYLQPQRMAAAKSEIMKLGLPITFENENQIDFTFKGHKISYYPYSGWATGKTIQDGRGWSHLFSQLNEK